MKVIMGISDRVIVLNVGEKIADGTPQEVASNSQVIAGIFGERVHMLEISHVDVYYGDLQALWDIISYYWKRGNSYPCRFQWGGQKHCHEDHLRAAQA